MTPTQAATLVGVVGTLISVGIPVLLWLFILRPWKPSTRLQYATRFALWPFVYSSFGIGKPLTFEIFGIRAPYQMSLGDSLLGLVGLSLILAVGFFGIGWIRGRKLSASQN